MIIRTISSEQNARISSTFIKIQSFLSGIWWANITAYHLNADSNKAQNSCEFYGVIIRSGTANLIKPTLMIKGCFKKNKKHAKWENLAPPGVSANRRASLCEPSHFIMQLSPHLSSAISGFLLMADTAAPSIPARETGRWLWGLGEWEWYRVLLFQREIAYATFGRLQSRVQILSILLQIRSQINDLGRGFKIIFLR